MVALSAATRLSGHAGGAWACLARFRGHGRRAERRRDARGRAHKVERVRWAEAAGLPRLRHFLRRAVDPKFLVEQSTALDLHAHACNSIRCHEGSSPSGSLRAKARRAPHAQPRGREPSRSLRVGSWNSRTHHHPLSILPRPNRAGIQPGCQHTHIARARDARITSCKGRSA
jgi:hypothetical protein